MLPQPIPNSPYPEAQQQEILTELARILATAPFLRSTTLSGLLRFLVTQDLAGESHSLKEAYIGHAHYGRQPGYDTKLDAMVRVSANRLRMRLRAQYEISPDVVLQITIPMGSYIPCYVRLPRVASEACSVIKEQALPAEESSPVTEQITVTDSRGVDGALQPNLLPQRSVPSTTPDLSSTRAPLAARAGSLHFTPRWVVVLVVALLFVGVLFWSQHGRALATHEPWIAEPFSRLGGVEEFPAISPDGKLVAFSWTTEQAPEQEPIYLQGWNADTVQRLTLDGGLNLRPAWSPSGQEIAFIHEENGSKALQILRLADHQQRTVTHLNGSYPWLCDLPRLSWTHDGKHIITADSLPPGNACRIVEVDVSTGVKQALSFGASGVVADVEPEVSPNGKQIAFLRNTGTMVGDLYTLDLNGGNLTRITHDERDVMGFCWDGSSGGFILSSRRGDGLLRLWRYSGPPSRFERLTDGLAATGFPAASVDGRRIVVSAYRNTTSIWRVWIPDESTKKSRPAEQLIADGGSDADATTSPDGQQIAFRSDRAGSIEIWVSHRDGGQPRRLTYFNGPMVSRPVWSRDGQTVAFECRDRGYVDICEIAAGGGPVRHPVSWNSDQERPAWSSDGLSLYFVSNHSGRSEVYRLTSGQSTPEPATREGLLGVAAKWSGRNLLIARELPVSGVYCGPSDSELEGVEQVRRPPAALLKSSVAAGKFLPAAISHCAPGRLLFPLGNDAAREQWDTTPGGFWYVQPDTDDLSTVLYSYDLNHQRSKPLVTFPHGIMLGDRSFMVEPGGQSALLVEQGPQSAELYTLKQGPQSY